MMGDIVAEAEVSSEPDAAAIEALQGLQAYNNRIVRSIVLLGTTSTEKVSSIFHHLNSCGQCSRVQKRIWFAVKYLIAEADLHLGEGQRLAAESGRCAVCENRQTSNSRKRLRQARSAGEEDATPDEHLTDSPMALTLTMLSSPYLGDVSVDEPPVHPPHTNEYFPSTYSFRN